MKSRLEKAMTLMEVLVVITIIALLMAILLPATTKSREAARRAVCMSNIRSIGLTLHTYAHNNEGRLIQGDGQYSWQTWGYTQQVNLGYLLCPNKELPMPTSDKHVFFCPSMSTPEGDNGYKRFEHWWGRDSNGSAPISYMFNNALDGFNDTVESAENCMLVHRDRANFMLGDGSVNFINIRPMVYDENFGPEGITQICKRYNATFPTIMLFNWFEREKVDSVEAMSFMKDPKLWLHQNIDANETINTKPVILARVAKKALVADIVGGWGGGTINRPGGGG